MKRAITLLLVIAVLLGGVFVSCKKKTSNEDIKKKIEANTDNQKNINRKLVKPIMKKQIDIRKLRRALKKRDVKGASEGTVETKGNKVVPAKKEAKVEEKTETEKK